MAKKTPAHHTKSAPRSARPSSKPHGHSSSHTSKDLQSPANTAPPSPSLAELSHYQQLLSVFTQTFGPVLQSDVFSSLLQEVKAALYERDFERAFAQAEYLDVYAARWSPTRALGYARVLKGIENVLQDLVLDESQEVHADVQRIGKGSAEGNDLADGIDGGENGRRTKRVRVLSIGGGAAETAAFASFLSTAGNGDISGDLTLLDTGPWKDVVDRLHTSLTTPPVLSKYASAAAREANRALLHNSRFHCHFIQQDILTWDETQLAGTLGTGALLVTLLFTLNELYTSGGIAKTTLLLRRLTMCIPCGSLLLVVDSPGSYSEATVGKEARRYPMHWLLDHTLLASEKLKPTAQGCHWEKLDEHDSIWFRIPEGLRYPIPLENMRYQMHLYRAVTPDLELEG